MKRKWIKRAEMILGVVAGNAILALCVAAFIVPKGIIMGGATGIGLTINHYLNADLSFVILVINACLFTLGAFVLGKKFALSTIASTFIYPFFLSVFQRIPRITQGVESEFLAVVYGGVLLGVGIGLIIRVGSSTGGTDIIALALNKWFHWPVAILLYVVDFVVLAFQISFSDFEQILYGIVNLVLCTIVLNKVIILGKSQIQVFIISKEYEAIRESLLKNINVGATMVHIETGYGNEEQKGVLCVLNNRRLYGANELIYKIDPQAFVTISQINEVKGRGFSLERVEYKDLT
ncbi:uncharacterized membrane-anchored protein YitT (DUF2179 family) [Aequitasia blattaphilus]|uniref:YitT family protein n=1 Tax=Aequitasia blattaphilus TaxID=2949332 RepID=A0ABT1EBP6_9FIRM|nr:YitT family protein [Aequitasia blattaphilus]MCP1103259.1 YitT family protein [Aequitasia blattaphilus]MCR8615899.1 YitT family protein [Aequitasia blattaphilus]